MSDLYLFNAMAVLAAMLVIWTISVVRRDVSLADPFWGTGFAMIAWISWIRTDSAEPRMLLLVCLTTVWAMRLSVFLLWRNWGQDEDRRYAAMRKTHGSAFWLVSLATVFLLQGGLMWFISLPLQAIAADNASHSLSWLDGLGIALWTNGFFWEAVGDWQLARFKAAPENAGHVMDRGLWRYTRHPNYFGDFCIWWGLYVISAAGGGAWTIGSPLLMSFLLLKVSGVTLLEQSITERRPEYAEYQLRTNAFFPGKPAAGNRTAEGKGAV